MAFLNQKSKTVFQNYYKPELPTSCNLWSEYNGIRNT